MNTLISTPFKLSTLVLSTVITGSLAGAVLDGFARSTTPTSPVNTMLVQLPTVVVIGRRDAVVVPATLQADAQPATSTVTPAQLKSGA